MIPRVEPAFASMTGHDLFRHIQKRIRLGWNWEPIADELGCNARDLVDWVNDYKWPEKKKPVVSEPREALLRIPARDRSPKKMTAQYLAWKRQHDGVVATRRALEAAGQ